MAEKRDQDSDQRTTVLPSASSHANTFNSNGPTTGPTSGPTSGFTQGTEAAHKYAGETPLPSSGDQVGRFTLEEQIGQGGQGAVFIAKDTRLGRRVALKLLLNDQAQGVDAVQRFISEGQIQSKLNHPNIVQIYDMGRDQNWLYIAMEYCPGETLRFFAKRRLLSLKDSLVLIRDVADGLAHAHQNGLVHRDIKPSNILIDPQGRARIIDFGIAKATEGQESDVKTRAGLVVGSLNYIAPEIFQGVAASPGSDYYALGLVLYEALTGQLPFTSENRFETLARIREGALDLPPAQRGLIPNSTLGLIRNLTHPDPKLRLSDGAKIRELIEKEIHDLDIRPLGEQWTQSLFQSGIEIHRSTIETTPQLDQDYSALNWILSAVRFARLEQNTTGPVSESELRAGFEALESQRETLKKTLGASTDSFVRKAVVQKAEIPWSALVGGVLLGFAVLAVGFWRFQQFNEAQQQSLASSVPSPSTSQQKRATPQPVIEGFAGLVIEPPGSQSLPSIELASSWREPSPGKIWFWRVLDRRAGVEIVREEKWRYLGQSQGLHVVEVNSDAANRLWFGPNWVADLRAAVGQPTLTNAKTLNRRLRGEPHKLFPLKSGRTVVFERADGSQGGPAERLSCKVGLLPDTRFSVNCNLASQENPHEIWLLSKDGEILEFQPEPDVTYRLAPYPESSSK